MQDYISAEQCYLTSIRTKQVLDPESDSLALKHHNLGHFTTTWQLLLLKSLEIKEAINSPTIENTRNNLRLLREKV